MEQLRRSKMFCRRVYGSAGVALLAGAAMAWASPPDPDGPPQPPVLYTDDADSPDGADAIFFLAPWGDPNITWVNCSEETPFLTLEQTREEVFDFIMSTGGPSRIQVRIAGGVYPMSEPVTFVMDDSGWAPDISGSRSIQYVAWDLTHPETGLPSGDDVLFTGGVQVTGWLPVVLPNGTSAYRAQVPGGITEIRDVWVNNFRMIRARFPNLPPCTAPHTHPQNDRPCEFEGMLRIKRVEAEEDQGQRFQRVILEVVDNSGPIPQPADWSEVEAVVHWTYVNHHQRVGEGHILPTGEAVLDFPITQWPTPGNPPPIDAYMDMGALGPFRWDGWRPENNEPIAPQNYTYNWRFLEVAGVENDTTSEPGGARRAAAQAYLVNSLAFLDSDREWYFDPQFGYLYLNICRNPDENVPGEGPLEVIVPMAEQLVVVEHASHLLFKGLSFAHTHQPMPKLRDGITPGYSSVQGGLQWSDEAVPNKFEHNHIVSPAIDILGSRDVRLFQCRIAHTGGSGVAIRTWADTEYGWFAESHECRVDWCEIFDTAGHGVYIGDEYVRRDGDWPHEQVEWRTVPSYDNWVRDNRIQNFGLIYKDSVGIYLGHGRRTNIIRNEISWGNWSGMSLGTVRHRQWVPIGVSCETSAFQQQTEGTWVHENHIHNVMYTLHDGGGIYMAGSHVPYDGEVFRYSRLRGNYIHDIVLNPRLHYGPNNVFGVYFDSGSTGWLIVGNYVERAQNMYGFHHRQLKDPTTSACQALPSIFHCGGVNDGANRFWQTAWPVVWADECAPNELVVFPAMLWNSANPNYWLDSGGTMPGCYDGPYWCFDKSMGSAGMNTPDFGDPPNPGSVNANIKVTEHTTPVQTIINSAGPHSNTAGWFFPDTVRRIHRTTFCNEDPQDLERQMQ